MNIEEIKNLVNLATTAPTKADAERYIQQLAGLRLSADLNSDTELGHYVSDLFDGLLSSVKAASGQARDKEHWMRCVKQDVYKLESRLRGKSL